MIVNLVLFSGIYYMKVKHPDDDFLSLKLDQRLLEEEQDLMEHTDTYDDDHVAARGSLTSHQAAGNAYDRTPSVASESHMESMEKVRSLSFV